MKVSSITTALLAKRDWNTLCEPTLPRDCHCIMTMLRGSIWFQENNLSRKERFQTDNQGQPCP
eukprot:4642858-Amphidinium_carterae.1